MLDYDKVSMNEDDPMEKVRGREIIPGIPAKLPVPAQRALAGHGIANLKQLTKKTKSEVEAWHGIGPNALKQLQKSLEENGLAFAEEK
ncbi:MAG: DNA-binding protein [Candidatus Hydrogenedentota bacterium]